MSSEFDVFTLALPGVRGLSPYQPGKPVEELERELGITGSIKLASNENPRGPGPAVRAAVAEAAQSLSRYPDGSAFAIRQRLAAELQLDPGQLTFGNGSNDVLEAAAHVFLGPGRSAICPQYAFVVYPNAIKAAGATLIEVPAVNYGADLPAMLAAVRDDTAMIFLANPNNPTGSWVHRAELADFLAKVPRKVIVVLDEAYFEYVDEPEFPNGIQCLAAHPNVIVTRTFSKVHGLAALRLGYAVSSPAIADLLNRVRQPFNTSSLAQVAGVAALNDRAYVAESRRLNALGMAQIEAGLRAQGVGFLPSIGNFLCVDCGGPAMPVYDALLREGVIVRPIGGYGMPNHLRITVGLPDENARFLGALARVHAQGSR
jgi:histidinol-phosphate aminotransferase